MEQVIQCLSAFLGCLGFAFVFRVHRHLPYALGHRGACSGYD